MSFNYGTNTAFGAIGHWDAPDIGWGVIPSPSRWNHLVYTFDGTTTRVFVNGAQTNSEIWPPARSTRMRAQRSPLPRKSTMSPAH